MDEMLKTGDVSQKDNIRIRALMFSLQNDLNDNLRQQADIQSELATLLRFTNPSWVIADAALPVSPAVLSAIKLPDLQDSALQYRPDLAYLHSRALFQEHNIQYQKALAAPDLNVGVLFDKQNSYVPNYWGLTIGLPLPVFDRNKGNISAARLGLEQEQLNAKQLQLQVGNEVAAAYRKFMTASELLGRDNRALQDNYDVLMQNMINSYTRRQVSLLEFIDFFEAWKDTRIRESGLVAGQRNAAAELNFVINQSIIKL
jgi:cobalt-zinc-cadmium efflux system outer membrane protein